MPQECIQAHTLPIPIPIGCLNSRTLAQMADRDASCHTIIMACTGHRVTVCGCLRLNPKCLNNNSNQNMQEHA